MMMFLNRSAIILDFITETYDNDQNLYIHSYNKRKSVVWPVLRYNFKKFTPYFVIFAQFAGSRAGQALVDHLDLRNVGFTGSTPAGAGLMKR